VGDPARDGAPVQAEGHDNGGHGTALGDQDDDQVNEVRGILLAVEGGAGVGTEGAATEGAAITLVLLTMDCDDAASAVPPLQARRNWGKIETADSQEAS
jgi:hypothetical protein